MKRFFNIYILLLFLCLGNSSIVLSQAILNKDTIYKLSTHVNDSISIHYIGCSGFFIRKGNNVVLIDPYFSNHNKSSFFSGSLTNKSTIVNDVKRVIDSVFIHVVGDSTDRSGLIKTLLISHGHVDHYGDVPYLFESSRFNLDTVKIISSTTVQYYLAGEKIPDKNIVKQVESFASSPSVEGKWIYVNNKIRVLPILDEHAPHLRLAGVNFNLVTQKNEKKIIRHKYWRQYSSGQTLCYLIDFLNDDGSINFRAYVNSSACGLPYGIPVQSILNQHPVDIAAICVASFSNVKNYPQDLIGYLKPKHIIASHWEDFLNYSISDLKKEPKGVPLTNIKKFFRRLDKILFNLDAGITYTRPNVNTTIKFFYSNTRW